eukprot:5080273-Ditylum_brightwellii.AAC.1
MKNGLYGMNPCKDEDEPTINVQCLNSVEENVKFLSPRQLERAKQAHKLFEALGTPTTADIKAMI